MTHSVRIVDIQPVTHNVRRYRLEKPPGYAFEPGQATEVSIDASGWRDKKRPFTFTSLAEWQHLEFTIKSYSDHDGVTNRLLSLRTGDRLILRDVWGTITYKGPGTFIAGGPGSPPSSPYCAASAPTGTSPATASSPPTGPPPTSSSGRSSRRWRVSSMSGR